MARCPPIAGTGVSLPGTLCGPPRPFPPSIGKIRLLMSQAQADKVKGCGAKFSLVRAALLEMHAKYRNHFAGAVASYIPELSKVNPALFGIALATTDGEVYEVGDAR